MAIHSPQWNIPSKLSSCTKIRGKFPLVQTLTSNVQISVQFSLIHCFADSCFISFTLISLYVINVLSIFSCNICDNVDNLCRTSMLNYLSHYGEGITCRLNAEYKVSHGYSSMAKCYWGNTIFKFPNHYNIPCILGCYFSGQANNRSQDQDASRTTA